MNKSQPFARPTEPSNIARNAPCPCGSGRKYKNCCGSNLPTARADPAPPGLRMPQATASIGPVTDAGRFLASYSPLQQVVRHGQNNAADQPTDGAPAAAKQASQSAQAWLNQAARHEAAGSRSEAITALQMAVRLAPNNPIAHYNLGLLYAKANRQSEAIERLRQAVSLQPDFGQAHFRLGVALHDQGHDEEAIAAYRAAISCGAALRRASARLAELLNARGNTAEAADCYRRAANDTTWGRLQSANALVVEGKYAEAAVAVRRVLALDPTSADAEWLLGDILIFMGRLDEGVSHCDRTIELAPGAIGAYHSRVLARRVTEADRPLVARMAAMAETGSAQ